MIKIEIVSKEFDKKERKENNADGRRSVRVEMIGNKLEVMDEIMEMVKHIAEKDEELAEVFYLALARVFSKEKALMFVEAAYKAVSKNEKTPKENNGRKFGTLDDLLDRIAEDLVKEFSSKGEDKNA